MKIASINPILAIMLAVAIAATSCKDDEPQNSDTPPEGFDTGGKPYIGDGIIENLPENERIAIRYQFAAASILNNLAGLQEVTSDVATSKYEPTYGFSDDGETSTTRSMVLETTDDALSEFHQIIGTSSSEIIAATADGYQIVVKDVEDDNGNSFDLGTLTFHRGDGAASLGYIDVQIPFIPHLERINYIPRAAIKDNAGVNSPYKLGDLVYIPRGHYCSGYYLCVKPNSESSGVLVHMSEGELKDDETINQDNDDDGCWYPYNWSKNQRVYKTDVQAYVNFIVNNPKKVKIIKQFLNGEGSSAYRPSHTGNLWHIFPGGFDNNSGVAYSSDKPAAIRYTATSSGLFRTTYWFEISSGCTGGSQVSESNSFEYFYDRTWDNHAAKYHNFNMNVIHFDTQPISTAKIEFSSINEYFVTKEEEEEEWRKAEEERKKEEEALQARINAISVAAEDVTTEHLGWCYASNNRLFEMPDDALEFNLQPLGILVYVNDGTSNGKLATEQASGYGHGLVMSYKEIKFTRLGSSSYAWEGYPAFVSSSSRYREALTDFDGLAKTKWLLSNNSEAAQSTTSMRPVPASDKTSGWFIPTTGQWLAILCKPGIGNSTVPGRNVQLTENLDGDPVSNINEWLYLYDNADDIDGEYWTSSAYNTKRGFLARLNNSAKTFFIDSGTTSSSVRPVFAF